MQVGIPFNIVEEMLRAYPKTEPFCFPSVSLLHHRIHDFTEGKNGGAKTRIRFLDSTG